MRGRIRIQSFVKFFRDTIRCWAEMEAIIHHIKYTCIHDLKGITVLKGNISLLRGVLNVLLMSVVRVDESNAM